MITFERLTLDTDFDVWDIFYNGIKIGYLRRSDKYYLEVMYKEYKLRLTQRRFVLPIIELGCGLMELRSLKTYEPKYNFKELTKGVDNAKGFIIKN